MKKIAKWYVRKTSFKWIISLLVIISAGVNSPKLIFYNLYNNTWQKSNALTLILSDQGNQTVKGPLLIISTILIELIPYITVIVLNIILLYAIKDHLKTLKAIEDASNDEEAEKLPNGCRMRRKRIHFDIYDEDDSEEETAVDIVVIVNIESDSGIEGETIKKDEASEVKMEKKEAVDMRTDIEITRFSLTKMLQLSYIVYILGHSLFVFSSIFVQIKFFFYYGPLMNLFKDHFLVINLVIAVSYWFLYISFGANFFVYFAFNGLFRKMINNSTKSKDQKNENADEENPEDDLAIVQQF